MKTVRQELAEERLPFRNDLKIYCRINGVSHKSIADQMELSEQEFHNMLTGFQATVKNKNILSFDEFKERIFEVLEITEF